MPEKILDLHIHSRYSRACSKNLFLPIIAKTCEIRGIDIVATGDFTHPAWMAHMKEYLIEDTAGIYKLRDDSSKTRFIVGTEVSSIKKHAGETRRVHHLIFAPSIAVAEKFNAALEARGCNLKADGRPILGLTSKQLLEICLEIDPRLMLVPAHAWTPWFGIFGSKGGYDSLEEAFEDLTPHVRAIETGLSSDPLMNWRWSVLDNITLISNSDAHSPDKLGREANVMKFTDSSDATYDEIMRILAEGDREKFLYTIEFYPEEGKYHFDGHMVCKFSCPPEDTKKKYHGVCPVCKKPLTIGVMYRVDELSDRTDTEARNLKRIPYKSLAPLPEIIADALECGVATKGVKKIYDKLIQEMGSEFFILLHADREQISASGSAVVAEAIERVRAGKVSVRPGYDGVFGAVKIFGSGERRGRPAQAKLVLE